MAESRLDILVPRYGELLDLMKKLGEKFHHIYCSPNIMEEYLDQKYGFIFYTFAFKDNELRFWNKDDDHYWLMFDENNKPYDLFKMADRDVGVWVSDWT